MQLGLRLAADTEGKAMTINTTLEGATTRALPGMIEDLQAQLRGRVFDHSSLRAPAAREVFNAMHSG